MNYIDHPGHHLLVIAIFCSPAPKESVLATITPSSTPSSKNAYLTAFIFAKIQHEVLLLYRLGAHIVFHQKPDFQFE